MIHGKIWFAAVALMALFAVCAVVLDDLTPAFVIVATISLVFLASGIAYFPRFQAVFKMAIPSATNESEFFSMQVAGTQIPLRPYVQVATCTLTPKRVPELVACGAIAIATIGVVTSGLASYRPLLIGWGLFALEAACFAAALVSLFCLHWADECRILGRAHCALAGITGINSGLAYQQLTYEFADAGANRFGGYTRVFGAVPENTVVVFYDPKHPDENRAHPSLLFHRVRVRSVGALKLGEGAEIPAQSEEAVVIVLDGQGLDDAVYQTYDLSTLEDRLIEQIEPDGIGVLDGHETGPTQTTIYLYGSNAEELFSRVRPVLATYPLCKNSRVVVRRGGPGSSQREVMFPFS